MFRRRSGGRQLGGRERRRPIVLPFPFVTRPTPQRSRPRISRADPRGRARGGRRRIAHPGLTTALADQRVDLERTTAFYRDLLGASLWWRAPTTTTRARGTLALRRRDGSPARSSRSSGTPRWTQGRRVPGTHHRCRGRLGGTSRRVARLPGSRDVPTTEVFVRRRPGRSTCATPRAHPRDLRRRPEPVEPGLRPLEARTLPQAAAAAQRPAAQQALQRPTADSESNVAAAWR